MKVTKYKVRETFNGEYGDKLEVTYGNMGEPYREGAEFHFESGFGNEHVNCFLEKSEVQRLRNILNDLLEKMKR